LDNTLSRSLADLNPSSVIVGKGLMGGVLSVTMAILWHESRPAFTAALALLACGAVGYGLSLRFYLLAQRTLGAARTGSVFAAAPFVGAAVAIAVGQPSGGIVTISVAAVMLAGVYLHLTESHAHKHAHAMLNHEHAHRHDDGHHTHHHADFPAGLHSHKHQHDPETHSHAHAPDIHHQHGHDSEV
jgi:hypothetical protein